MIISLSSSVMSFASPCKLISTSLLRLNVAEIQHGEALKSLIPKPSANFKHLFHHKDTHYSTLDLGIFMYTYVQVLNIFIFNFHIFMAAESHHCTCLQLTIIKFYKKQPKILLLDFCADKSSSTMTRIEEGAPLHINIPTCHF